MNNKLSDLGITDKHIGESKQYEGLFLGRVVAQYKDIYKVATENSDVMAEISGKFRYCAAQSPDYPAVGDFVMLDRESDVGGNAIIHAVLSRKSVFERRAAGNANGAQVIAANIDTVFICMSLNNDFNLRRLERYLSIAWNSGSMPVIVLTKSDLCEDLSKRLAEVKAIALGADVIVTTSISGDGYKPVLRYIAKGKTVAFIGSSGVGKSTLINRLIGGEMQSTKEIRKDDRGRHATTRRELIIIPSGGAVIDTPGMRELGIEGGDFEKAFADIDMLAQKCKFRDCTHKDEPFCAVKKAVEDGLITEERLLSYKKLRKEAKYEGLNSKQIEKEKMDDMYSGFSGVKNARDYVKSKHKNR